MKVFLAATEDSETSSNLEHLNIENIFMSYYYLREKARLQLQPRFVKTFLFFSHFFGGL